MKILFIVNRPLEINTSSSIRNIATIKGLLENGNEVDLITTKPDENHKNFDNSFELNSLKIQYLNYTGVQNFRNIYRKFYFLKFLKKTFSLIISFFQLYDNYKYTNKKINEIDLNLEKYDLIISSSDPKSSHLLVNEILLKKNISQLYWIQIWGDPFFYDISRKNRFFDFYIKKIEYRLLKNANKVIYVSEKTLIQQQRLFPDLSNKMNYIPVPYIKESIYRKFNQNKKKLTFFYSGDYSSKIRDIYPLYKSIIDSNHQLIICGLSDIKLEHQKNVLVYDRLTYTEIKKIEATSDILIHLSNKSGNQIPGKIFHYSATNKPILFILDGDRESLKLSFEKYNRFIFCNNDKNNIDTAILNIKDSIKKINLVSIKEFSPMMIAKKIIEKE